MWGKLSYSSVFACLSLSLSLSLCLCLTVAVTVNLSISPSLLPPFSLSFLLPLLSLSKQPVEPNKKPRTNK